PPQVQQIAERPPRGVSASVWSVVVNSGMPQGRWAKTAKALELLKTQKPDAFEKLVSHGHITYDKVLKALSDAIAQAPQAPPQKFVARAASVAEKAAANAPAS